MVVLRGDGTSGALHCTGCYETRDFAEHFVACWHRIWSEILRVMYLLL
jgi:hypothetical protein